MKDSKRQAKNRYEQGMEKFSQIRGKETDVSIKRLESLSPDLAKYAMEFPFGDIYSRQGLDLRSREIATMSSLITQGNFPQQLKVHIHCALNVGVTRQEIIEIILQMSVYVGFPSAINAMQIAKEVFDELDNEKRVLSNYKDSKSEIKGLMKPQYKKQ